MDYPLPSPVKTALSRLNAAGFEAYIVGGCVRDFLLGKQPQDFDLTTSALPEETARLFSDFRVIETGLRHGTVTVLIDKMPLEITTFRTEGGYSDHRRPDAVRFVSNLREDLSRRDFTVNAMAYNPRTGLVDLFGGRADLAAGLIRCVGDPARRFQEDALRIMRAVRFASQLGFTVEAETKAAAFSAAPLLRCISAERLCAELLKLLCGSHVRPVLLEYVEILGVFLPELLPMVGCSQDNPHHIYDVFTHSAVAVENVPARPHLRLAALLHDLGKPACRSYDEKGIGHFYGHGDVSLRLSEEILSRLRLDNAAREKICLLVKYHDSGIQDTERAVKRWLSRLGPDLFFDLLALKRGDNLAQAPQYRDRLVLLSRLENLAQDIIAAGACFALRDLAVNGSDLLSLGYAPGPALGRALDSLLADVIDGALPNEKQALLSRARKLLKQ